MSLKYNQITRIKVFGVGGAGCNAVNRMVEEGMQGAEFFVVNTDLQVLDDSVCSNKILIGPTICRGYGAGSDPKIGRAAVMESEAELKEVVKDADMIFVAAGMGGGTGTAAAPFISRLAKEAGALTVGIVTKPFDWEGIKRMRVALGGIEEMKEYVDALIVISNSKLSETIGEIPLVDSFKEADNILRQGIQTITDLIAVRATINLDFADVRSVMQGQGSALIGIGIANGENKAIEAAKQALNSPLLEASIEGAKKAIVNITGGKGMTLNEYKRAVNYITEAAGSDMELIAGLATNDRLGENIIVTVIATGFGDNKATTNSTAAPQIETQVEVETAEEPDVPVWFRDRN